MTEIEWLLSGDTGISSETILAVMTGSKMGGVFRADHPHDPSDFGRCYRLLNYFPEYKKRLGEVSNRYKKWKPLVDNWNELTALYVEESKNKNGRAPKLYAKMCELLVS